MIWEAPIASMDRCGTWSDVQNAEMEGECDLVVGDGNVNVASLGVFRVGFRNRVLLDALIASTWEGGRDGRRGWRGTVA